MFRYILHIRFSKRKNYTIRTDITFQDGFAKILQEQFLFIIARQMDDQKKHCQPW